MRASGAATSARPSAPGFEKAHKQGGAAWLLAACSNLATLLFPSRLWARRRPIQPPNITPRRVQHGDGPAERPRAALARAARRQLRPAQASDARSRTWGAWKGRRRMRENAGDRRAPGFMGQLPLTGTGWPQVEASPCPQQPADPAMTSLYHLRWSSGTALGFREGGTACCWARWPPRSGAGCGPSPPPPGTASRPLGGQTQTRVDLITVPAECEESSGKLWVSAAAGPCPARGRMVG